MPVSRLPVSPPPLFMSSVINENNHTVFSKPHHIRALGVIHIVFRSLSPLYLSSRRQQMDEKPRHGGL